MNINKKKRLEAAGWKVGDTREFLDLSEEEALLVETRVALSREIKRRREKNSLTQAALAEEIHSSQSRVAKMEAGESSVSLDLLIRTLFHLGATRSDLSKAMKA